MEEMKSSALERGMSRRSLLKWAGLATVGSAALGATGCVGFNEKTPISDTGDVDENPGEWIPCSCWVDCGSKGFNKALVKMARWYASAPISRTRILPTVRSYVAVLADVHFVA